MRETSNHKVVAVAGDFGGVNVHCGLGFDVVVLNHLADGAFIGWGVATARLHTRQLASAAPELPPAGDTGGP